MSDVDGLVVLRQAQDDNASSDFDKLRMTKKKLAQWEGGGMTAEDKKENEWPVKSVFVELDYVLSKKGGAVLVDTRSEDDYLKGHIPGAISLGRQKLKAALLLRDTLVRMRPLRELEKILGSKGIARESEIILYGVKSDFYAAVVYWILDVLGFPEIRFFNDGIAGAAASGVELETAVNTLAPVKLKAAINESLAVTTERVYENLTSQKALLMDVRTPGEHSGGDPRALRGGRIPGSINIHVEDNLANPKSRTLKPVNELKELYKNLDPDREVIIYCQLATRAAYTYVILKALGFKKAASYDDSWIIWGNRIDLPVERVSWFNRRTFKFISGTKMMLSLLVVIAKGSILKLFR